MKSLSPPLRLALCLALFAGCAPSSAPGSAQFAISVPQALSASDVSRVVLTVSAADMDSLSVEMASSNGSWGGLVGNIPSGSNRFFLAEAFDSSGALRFQGQSPGVSISPDQTTAVALTVQTVSPSPAYANEAPLLDSLVASSTSVLTGGTLSLTATAHDVNPGDTLSLAWTATGGSFSAPSAAATSWTAPSSPGIQTLTLAVTDSQGVATAVSLAVNVLPGSSTGNGALTLAFNLWPVVSKVSASLNRLDAGQSTSVSALASDADGDALSYQWASSCAGTWTQASSSTASFVPSSVPTSDCNNCQLTVTVQDGRGGQAQGSLSLCVASASTERFPPRFIQFSQSAPSASPGQTVTFDVTALDPQASSLKFAWSAPAGTLGTPVNGASTSRITWTAPSCTPTSTPSVITATVTNAFKLTASQSFSVAPAPLCAVGWVSAGAMFQPRDAHTATLLPQGKVLVSGGRNGANSYLAASEVYNPATGTWSATASMNSPRRNHTATLLQNGKVLVTGGHNGSIPHATAEVYDPASGTWSATGSMAYPRGYHTATLLPNGKVLVAGGTNASLYLTSAEVYDPASGTWSRTSSMAIPRGYHTATLLQNGKVLIAGGYNSLSGYLSTAVVYDPASDSWSATGSMGQVRAFYATALLPDGKVLVAGGLRSSSETLATAEVYDPATGTWSATDSMASLRSDHTATLLPNGKILVSGGGTGATAEMYDPASGTWSAAAAMPSPRQFHTATLLQNGKVLVAGGTNTSGYLPIAALYSP
ncbi:kelch repeat-containing protein [Stigmatella sp. ncwal1]|uniref:Kelch repeat-containing protein n=1 Tax=Stigmatella ashevillensis TaxID=2995309 RepID=A0ABT5D1Z1_9BACT|nr:kelch repeat-containing protein [Stigmatella ashevillena]MDC0707682.1 kelch repeat-containing protein [Stigmatella ashevillena]